MAEYYPLLAKAIAGLPNSTRETRYAVYERARKALLGQLRAVQPPVPEADIEREGQALDQAIARLEAELAGAPAPEVSAAPPPPVIEPPPAPAALRPTPVPPPPPKSAPAAPAAPPPVRPRIDIAPPTGSEASETTDAVKTPEIGAPPAPEPRKPPPPLGGPERAPIPVKMRPDPQRPTAPQVQEQHQGSKGLWIVLAVIGLIVAGVAFAAWKLRDRPEDLAKAKPASTQQQTETNGKIVGRVGEAPANTAAPAASSAAAPAQTQPDTQTNVPVTYRAALLVQAPEEKDKVKTYFGTVNWRLENVSNGPGQALGTAIHANVDVPEDKLQVSVTLQKNVDASLPASHTMTIVFNVQSATATGTVKQIGLPQMRKEDSATGDSLAGLPVPIMDNSFLIGLSNGNAEASNLDLLKTRQWIDIPMLLADGRIAKLTFEKGVAGQRATEDAITSWQTQQ